MSISAAQIQPTKRNSAPARPRARKQQPACPVRQSGARAFRLRGQSGLCVGTWTLAVGLWLASGPVATAQQNVIDTPNAFGTLRTIMVDGDPLDHTSPFFQSLGTNGRSCSSCHVASSAWTITPTELQQRFQSTGGLDPIFRTIDGSNSPNANVSTVNARRKSYSMLLNKGVIRIGLPVPAGAEFALVHVDDPYRFASASELSLFRRPLPATNLRFLTAVMWDGRESFAPMGTTPILSNASRDQNGLALFHDLKLQANNAVLTHAQGAVALTDQMAQAIAEFELNLATAQQRLDRFGPLDVGGARGGPAFVATQPFYVTINDVLGADQHGHAFEPDAMTLFSAWATEQRTGRDRTRRHALRHEGDCHHGSRRAQ